MIPGRLLALFFLLAAVVVGGVWNAARPPALPAATTDVARQELPALREKVRAEPGSADARLALLAAYQILGDRIGAWQQAALAEAGVPTPLIRRVRSRVAESLGRLEDAAGAAERARRERPADLDGIRESFRLHTLLGDFERAFAIARDALSHQPDHGAALALHGEACFNVSDYAAAVKSLKAVERVQPADTTVGVQLAVALLRAERGKEAASRLTDLVRRPDVPASAWEYLGQARLSQGETAAAGEAFARAEAVGAPGGGAAFGAALVALTGGDRAATEKALRRALERDPEHEAAATTLAQLLAAGGRGVEAAVVRGRAALARDEAADAVRALHDALGKIGSGAKPAGVVPVLLLQAQALRAEEDGPGALAALRRAAALAPADPGIARRRVETAHAAFAPQEALRAIDRYARLAPADTAQVAWWRFRAYRQLQDRPRAEAALTAAARFQPDQPEILIWQARSLLENAPDAAQVAAAGDRLRRAVRATPDDLEARSSFAEVLIRQKAWSEAGEHLRRALALDPYWGRGRHWLQLAQADRALGLAKEAAWDAERYREGERGRVELEKARAASRSGDAGALVRWSTAARHEGRLREARAAARAAVRADPSSAPAYRALAAACQRLGRLEDRIVAMEAVRAVSAR